MTSNNDQDLSTPGLRLKYIRGLVRVSRAYLQDKYGIPEVTLKSWENGTTKLTQTGVDRCVEAYRSEGLILSPEWILNGVGFDPKLSVTVSHYFAYPSESDLPLEDDEVAMVRDANLFKEQHPNSVVMIVSNDEMRPFYWPGDYVGGKVRKGDQIEGAINKECIVTLKSGDRYFRRLIKNSDGGYNLTCQNPNTNTAEPVLFNVDIDSVAPVIWHRRKDE